MGEFEHLAKPTEHQYFPARAINTKAMLQGSKIEAR